MGSYAATTQGGLLFDQGMSLATDFGNKYPDNEAVGGMVAGTIIDAARDQISTGLAMQYNTSMSSHYANIQKGLEDNRTGNTLKIMGNEGRIAKDLIGAQGQQQRMGIRETGSQQRMNIGAQGTQDRLNIGATGAQQRLNIGAQGTQDRLNIGATGTQQRLNIGAQGVEDRALVGAQGIEERMNIGARGSEQRKGLRTAGSQERLNIGKRYQEERNMRADARGAIRSLGSRFFG